MPNTMAQFYRVSKGFRFLITSSNPVSNKPIFLEFDVCLSVRRSISVEKKTN